MATSNIHTTNDSSTAPAGLIARLGTRKDQGSDVGVRDRAASGRSVLRQPNPQLALLTTPLLPPPPPDSRSPYQGCSEIFVGAGWGGIYSFYRRVLDGVQSDNQNSSSSSRTIGHRYCLMEQSSRIGGRTYSVHVPRRHTGGVETGCSSSNSSNSGQPAHEVDVVEADFVLDVGAARFSPDMHLVGDLIMNQLLLPTECYEPNCPSPITLENSGENPRRPKFNFTSPFRRLIDPSSGLPSGFDTALHKMVETCQSLGARVYLNTRLVRLQTIENNKQRRKVARLEFEDTTTGIRSAIGINNDDDDNGSNNTNVVILNLPRNHLFNVEGVRESLEPQVAKALECIVFDAHEGLIGKETFQRIHEDEQYVTTIGKAYLYYEDAWWRSKLNETVGSWPPQDGTRETVQTPQGVLLNIQWHDGPVQCQRHYKGALHIAPPPFSSSSSAYAAPLLMCRGFLEVYYSASNETFYSSLPAATDDDDDDDDVVVDKFSEHVVDPLGMVWVKDSPHAASELNLVHTALMESLRPLWCETPELSKAMQEVSPPSGMVVGIWQRPNPNHPLGLGWTSPTKVIYEPSMSGTPDQACGVPGLTDKSYRHAALQPFDVESFLPEAAAQEIRRPPSNIFLINNDYVCSHVRSFSGDWAEESLLQAERAMYVLGTPKPSWLHAAYYKRHVVDPQLQVAEQPFAATLATPVARADLDHSTKLVITGLVLVIMIIAIVAIVVEWFRFRNTSAKATHAMIISHMANGSHQDHWDTSFEGIIVMTKNQGPNCLMPLNDVANCPSTRGDCCTGTTGTDECVGEDDDNDNEGDDNSHNDEDGNVNTKNTTNNNDDDDSNDNDRDDGNQHPNEVLDLWSLEHLAIPVCYGVCGFVGGLFRIFLNVYPIDIGANEAQQTTIITFSTLPSVFMLLYGFISDTYPIFGYRRKPYIFLGWLLSTLSMLFLYMTSDLTLEREKRVEYGCADDEGHRHERIRNIVLAPENAPTLWRLSLCCFGFYLGKWFATATADAWVAEKAKLESESVRGALQSTCYVFRFFCSMVSGSISTYLYTKVGPGIVVVCMIGTPILVLPLTWWLAEVKVDVKPVREQCREIWHTVCLRKVWEPIGLLYLHNVLQMTNVAWRQFMVSVLQFTPDILNTFLVVSYTLVYLGSVTYKYCLLKTSWRLIYQSSLFLTLTIRTVQLMLIRGSTFGLPPFVLALVDYVLVEFLRGIKYLPAVFIMVALCPVGSEGVSYCMFTTVMHSSFIIADTMSSLLLSIWDVSEQSLDKGSLDGMFKLSLLAMTIQFSPLLFIHRLPAGRKELEEISFKSFPGSPIGGAIFLFVLFGSMGVTLTVSILNITRPGWVGES